MSLSRTKTIVALVLVVLACSGVGLTMQATSPPDAPPGEKTAKAKAPAAKPPKAKPAKPDQDEPAEAALAEERIEPGQNLLIRVKDALPDAPIDGFFEVEVSGKVPLGPDYGRVNLKGLTYEEGEAALRKHLEKVLKPGFKVMIVAGDSQNAHLHTRRLAGPVGGGFGALGGGGGGGALGGVGGGGALGGHAGGGMGGMAAGEPPNLCRAITELTAEIRGLRKAVEELNKKGK